MGVLRYGVVFLLLVFGAAKFFMFEAQGIRPLVETSPFPSWMPGAFGLRGTSFLFSTPGALAPTHPANGFLVKDLILLGACLATCAEALRRRRSRAPAARPRRPFRAAAAA